MSITPKFKTEDEAHKAGWFSRRHETSKEHQIAHEKMLEKKRKKKGNQVRDYPRMGISSMVERYADNIEVIGSIPIFPTPA